MSTHDVVTLVFATTALALNIINTVAVLRLIRAIQIVAAALAKVTKIVGSETNG